MGTFFNYYFYYYYCCHYSISSQPGSQCDNVVGAQDGATLPPGLPRSISPNHAPDFHLIFTLSWT